MPPEIATRTLGEGMAALSGQKTIWSVREGKCTRAPERCNEAEWDLPGNFEGALEELALMGRAARHVCDNGRVFYEIQWSRPRPFATGAHRFH